MIKNSFKKLVILIIILLLPIGIWGCSQKETEENAISYISDATSFIKALQNGESTIYVGNIAFESQTEITLNYSLEIIGMPEKSLLENAHFKLLGTNVPSEITNVSFKNIYFDGKVNKDDIPFEDGKTFDEIVGEIPQWHAVNGSTGYLNLSIDNCEIANYLCADGPAVYINNDTNYREGVKKFNLTNSKIHNNIAYAGTVKVFSDILETNIDNCEFYANTARAGQGIAVGNGHSFITNTTIHDNGFFRFINNMERKLPKIFHDDRQTFKGLTTNALGGCCGAMFIGGSHTTVDSCKIFNNKTIFGGGIGIINSATLATDEKIEVKNTEISNNAALLCGGGIYLESNQGETTYFTNCSIFGNSAEEGSIIYTTTYSPDSDKNYGGNVQFTFCTMTNNNANDANTFAFYELLKPELAGNIALKGCFVLDNSPYKAESYEYNYIATKDQALVDNVITEEICSSDIITPAKDSVAYITVPADIYRTWIADFSEASESRAIGCIIFADDGDNSDAFPYWTLAFPAVAIVTATAVIIIHFRKKKKASAHYAQEYADTVDNYSQEYAGSAEPYGIADDELTPPTSPQEIDYSAYTFADIANEVKTLYGSILTKREITIATYTLYGKTRKEIANALFVSEDTIKTHLSHIFKKIGVSSKIELKKIIDSQICTRLCQ